MTYTSLHTKIRRIWGRATKCELCSIKNAKRYEWSNKNHKYKIRRSSWWQLCTKCHREYDFKKFGKKVWNRGLKGLQPWHNVSGLNSGEPWNKGKKETRPEVIEKLRKSHLGKIPWNKK